MNWVLDFISKYSEIIFISVRISNHQVYILAMLYVCVTMVCIFWIICLSSGRVGYYGKYSILWFELIITWMCLYYRVSGASMKVFISIGTTKNLKINIGIGHCVSSKAKLKYSVIKRIWVPGSFKHWIKWCHLGKEAQTDSISGNS
jgi:hypothetical protein